MTNLTERDRHAATRARLGSVGALLLVLALSLPARASATTLEKLTVKDMAFRASTVVEGVVTSTSAERAPDGTVRTAVRLSVQQSLKGAPAAEQTVYVPGGRLPDGTEVEVDGMASFAPGDRCFVFADTRGWVVGGFQGKIGVVDGLVDGTKDAAWTVSDSVAAALGTSAPAHVTSAGDGYPIHQVVPRAMLHPSDAPQPAQLIGAAGASWFFDGFESGSVYTSWTVIDSSTWGATTYRKKTGSYSAWCIGNNAYVGYPNDYTARMIRGPYNLSAATAPTVLSADLWLDSEANYDKAGMLVSIDGYNYYGTGWSGSVAAWQTKSLDLTNVSTLGDVSHAPSLSVMLVFSSDSSNSGGEGAYFDNVTLKESGGSSGTPHITGISPGSGSAGTDTHVLISGTGFGSTAGSVQFSYGRNGVMRIDSNHIASWSDTQIDCEVPTGQIDNYNASAGTGPVYVLDSLGGESNGYAFAVPFGYGGAHWVTPGVTYKVNTSGTDVARRENLVDAAAGVWNAAGSAFRYTDGGLTSAVLGSDGQSVICWANGLPAGVIAQATSWRSGGYVVECDIQMSNAYAWGDGTAATMDIQSITEHEVGHWLRLLDQYMDGDADKVMYGMSDTGVVKRTLTAGDLAGIRWIYPSSVTDTVEAVIDSVSPSPAMFGEAVSFAGHGTDPAHAITAYQWRSSIGGVLSSLASFSSSSLSPGTHTITFKAQCANGAWSPEVSRTLVVVAPPGWDATPPSTTSDVVPSYVGTATIHLTATDNAGGSGVAHTFYRLDTGPQTEGAVITVTSVGAHALEFWSVDTSGNVETPHKNASFAVTPVFVPTSITIRTNATTTYIGRTPILSGAITPNGIVGKVIVVYVKKPGKTYWTYSSNRVAYLLSGNAAWQYKYYFKPGMAKGTYTFKASIPEYPGFGASTSPTTVAIRLR